MPDRAVLLRRRTAQGHTSEIPMAWVAPRHARLGAILAPADIVQPYPDPGEPFEVVAVYSWLRETDNKGVVTFTSTS